MFEYKLNVFGIQISSDNYFDWDNLFDLDLVKKRLNFYLEFLFPKRKINYFYNKIKIEI